MLLTGAIILLALWGAGFVVNIAGELVHIGIAVAAATMFALRFL